MARRSRADMEAQRLREERQATEKKLFSVGIYARLSIENSNRSEEKDVITTQIDFCKNYIAAQTDMNLVQTYIDNGATGTNFKRNGLLEMIRDLELGVIDTVVVRDFSRFGRNRIECLRYLTKIFPDLGVRFVAINDFYDSLTADETSFEVLIKNIMNEFYSHDISRKTSTALRLQIKNGTFQKRILPYGYMWSEDKEEIIIDTEVSQYVQKMFQWRLEGLSFHGIAKRLDELQAILPEARNHQNGVRSGNCTFAEKWGKSSVQTILYNPHYTGDLVLGRTEMALYKGIKPHLVDENQWLTFPNNHPALVSHEDFSVIHNRRKELAKDRQEKKKESESERKKLVDLFTEKIFCADCGRKLWYRREQRKNKSQQTTSWTGYYACSTYSRKLTPLCTSHRVRQTALNELVLEAIKMQIKVGIDYEEILRKLKDSAKDKSLREKQNAHISSLRLKLNGIRQRNNRLYKDFVEGILTQDEYVFTKESYQQEIEAYTLRLEEAQQRKLAFDEAMSSDNKWLSLVKSISRTRKLNQSLVDMAIHKVLVYEDGTVELVLNFHDIYQNMSKGVEEVEKEVVE